MIVIVPARGGSKGLPGKNIRPFAGEPLIVHTLRAALAARRVERVLVTTDDDAILRVCRAVEGVEAPVRRPPHLAVDSADALDAYLHLVDSLEIMEGAAPKEVCVLLPTAPLRTPDDIDDAIALFERRGANAVISVSAAKPESWLHRLDAAGRMVRVLNDGSELRNRQEHEPVFLPNGSIYVFNVDYARRTGSIYGSDVFAHVMPPERSIDIDTEADFVAAEALYNMRYQDDNVRRLHHAV
ncbi:MAG: acylneuraminate cytidylyltransferase family protein [Alphaproteobacteria bacterium]|nr:acylneuraminate cytidylyltransferase family protein [Alphaproteobacteria bacterium]